MSKQHRESRNSARTETLEINPTTERLQHSTLISERENRLGVDGRVLGTTTRMRDPAPTALHVIAARIDMDPELRRVGEHLQELADRAGLVTRFGPTWARSSLGGEPTDAQADAHAEWNRCINAIPAYSWRSAVRAVCCCDELDGRADLLVKGLAAVRRHLGW